MKGRSRIRLKLPSADASFDDDSEDDIVPKQTGHAKKRDAHDDTPQDGADEAKDDPQDGLGNPNVSGIALPIPANLVESILASHETDFHIVTSGTEVGIFTNKYVFHSHLIVSYILILSQEELQMHAFSANSLCR